MNLSLESWQFEPGPLDLHEDVVGPSVVELRELAHALLKLLFVSEILLILLEVITTLLLIEPPQKMLFLISLQ